MSARHQNIWLALLKIPAWHEKLLSGLCCTMFLFSKCKLNLSSFAKPVLLTKSGSSVMWSCLSFAYISKDGLKSVGRGRGGHAGRAVIWFLHQMQKWGKPVKNFNLIWWTPSLWENTDYDKLSCRGLSLKKRCYKLKQRPCLIKWVSG